MLIIVPSQPSTPFRFILFIIPLICILISSVHTLQFVLPVYSLASGHLPEHGWPISGHTLKENSPPSHQPWTDKNSLSGVSVPIFPLHVRILSSLSFLRTCGMLVQTPCIQMHSCTVGLIKYYFLWVSYHFWLSLCSFSSQRSLSLGKKKHNIDVEAWTFHNLLFSVPWPVKGLCANCHILPKEACLIREEKCTNPWV